MRLTSEQKNQIYEVVLRFMKEISFELFLYGSRVNENLKGGDIDLLIVTNELGVKSFEENHLSLLVQLKKQSAIGQRHIDIKACTLHDLDRDPFLMSISKGMMKLEI